MLRGLLSLELANGCSRQRLIRNRLYHLCPWQSPQGTTQMSVISQSRRLHCQCPRCRRPFRRFMSDARPVMFCSRKCYWSTVRELLAAFYAQAQSEGFGSSL